VLLLPHRFFADAERAAEQFFVQHFHVQFTGFAIALIQANFADASANPMRTRSGAGLRKTCFSSSMEASGRPGMFLTEVGGDSAQHAMRRQNLEARRMHVHESHHHFLAHPSASILVAKRQRGFVAMMPIGDQQLLVRHQRLNARDHAGSEIFQTRCVTPYSSSRHMSGAAVAALIEHPIDRQLGSGYSMKICPKCARVWRSNSMRSFFGPESVCSWRWTTPAA
jgi:hypothetical protein